jgi:Sec7-like guanine-nucleotide exchange factor
MLNTDLDLHKSNQIKKGKKRSQIKNMSKDEFINNLRGVNKGNEIDRSYLSNIYDGIEIDPIALQHIADRNESEVFEQYNSMNDNVQHLDALLRGLAIQDYRFISL